MFNFWVELVINQSVMEISFSFKIRVVARLDRNAVFVHILVDNRIWAKNKTYNNKVGELIEVRHCLSYENLSLAALAGMGGK